MKFKYVLCALGLVLSPGAFGAYAQSNTDSTIFDKPLSLDGVVVSATRSHTSRKESPILVNVLGPKIFATTSSPTLAEGLAFQSGVRVENDCQNCGFAQARINGLCGHYSQILSYPMPST